MEINAWIRKKRENEFINRSDYFTLEAEPRSTGLEKIGLIERYSLYNSRGKFGKRRKKILFRKFFLYIYIFRLSNYSFFKLIF